ncbi:hypothetical protein [Alsobacter sp. R-9]
MLSLSRLRAMPLDLVAGLVGAAGVLCLVGWPIAVFAMISFIGLPLALLMAAVPTLALIVVTWRLAWRGLAAAGLRSVVASAIVTALLLAVPPVVYNARLQAQVTALTAYDRAEAAPLRSAAVIALREGYRGRGASCGDLCRRLLLTGAAARVLVSDTGFVAAPPASDTPMTGFRLAHLDGTCPDVPLESAGVTLRLPGETSSMDSATLMRASIVSGRCLVREPARLGDAGLVLSEGAVASGTNSFGAGLRPSADTVRARRLSVHVPASGGWTETFRRTAATWEPLAPILAPTYASGSGLELRPALLRLTEHRNTWGKALEPDWPAFLRDRLGLDVGLATVAATMTPAAAARTALAAGGPLPAAAAGGAADMFQRFAMQRRIDPSEADLALAVLRDRRIPVNGYAWTLGRYGGAVRPGYLQEVAEVLFARLREIAAEPVPQERRRFPYQAAGPIADGIAALPDEALRRHQADFEWLAAQPALRVPAARALPRLSIFGAAAVPSLLPLVELGRPASRKSGDDWRGPYMAALTGLCTAGPSASSALPTLVALLEGRELMGAGSAGRLLFQTLLALGEDSGRATVLLEGVGLEPGAAKREITRASRPGACSG